MKRSLSLETPDDKQLWSSTSSLKPWPPPGPSLPWRRSALTSRPPSATPASSLPSPPGPREPLPLAAAGPWGPGAPRPVWPRQLPVTEAPVALWPSWPHVCPHGSVRWWWKGQRASAQGGTRHLPWAGQTWPRRGKDRARGGPRRACRARGHVAWARGPGPGDTQARRPGSRGPEDLCPAHTPTHAKPVLAEPPATRVFRRGLARTVQAASRQDEGGVGAGSGRLAFPESVRAVSGRAACLPALGDKTWRPPWPGA